MCVFNDCGSGSGHQDRTGDRPTSKWRAGPQGGDVAFSCQSRSRDLRQVHQGDDEMLDIARTCLDIHWFVRIRAVEKGMRGAERAVAQLAPPPVAQQARGLKTASPKIFYD